MFKRYVFLLAVFAGLSFPGEAWCAGPGTASNAGFTGLWEYPTAEMPADGAGRFGFTLASPYAFYYVNLVWLPWLEVNTRLTTFENIYVAQNGWANDEGVGRRYMDKAMDIKIMLHSAKNWYAPSIAVGVTDAVGTELMQAWYGVGTWRLHNLAFSLGYGTDRMNGLFWRHLVERRALVDAEG